MCDVFIYIIRLVDSISLHHNKCHRLSSDLWGFKASSLFLLYSYISHTLCSVQYLIICVIKETSLRLFLKHITYIHLEIIYHSNTSALSNVLSRGHNEGRGLSKNGLLFRDRYLHNLDK